MSPTWGDRREETPPVPPQGEGSQPQSSNADADRARNVPPAPHFHDDAPAVANASGNGDQGDGSTNANSGGNVDKHSSLAGKRKRSDSDLTTAKTKHIRDVSHFYRFSFLFGLEICDSSKVEVLQAVLTHPISFYCRLYVVVLYAS